MTAQGDCREAIYEDDADRQQSLALLGAVIGDCDFNWRCHAHCSMDNHCQLVVETPDGKLSKGMRQLNGVSTPACNRRHGRTGYLFKGRYKAVLVNADCYLLELTRYVVLNPVRAGMVVAPGDWPWSSYRATVGADDPPAWLQSDALLAQFGDRCGEAVGCYIAFVRDGSGVRCAGCDATMGA